MDDFLILGMSVNALARTGQARPMGGPVRIAQQDHVIFVLIT